MTNPTFITEPDAQPHTWRVVYSGLEYPGEVIAAQRWSPSWGQRLDGDSLFRIVFLTEPPRRAAFAIQDRRIAVCVPGRRIRGAEGDVSQELKTIGEARAVYFAGRQPDASEIGSFLAEEEAKLQVRLLEQSVRVHAEGVIVTDPSLALDPAAIFTEPLPDTWITELAHALLGHAYPHLPVQPTAFPSPFGREHGRLLFDGLFAPRPDQEARTAVGAFASGLGLDPDHWLTSPLLASVGALLEGSGSSVAVPQALERLTHQEGLPQPLATLALLAFVARNRPAVELTLRPGGLLMTRAGASFSGSRITWDLLAELAWSDALADSLGALQLLQSPSWQAVLPYVEALYPGASVPAPRRDQAWRQRRFVAVLEALEGDLATVRHAMDALSGLGQGPPPEASASLDALRAVTGAGDHIAYYHTAVQASTPPHVLKEAADTLSKLKPLAAAYEEVLSWNQYLRSVALGDDQSDLNSELVALLAQFDLAALTASPLIWPGLRAQAVRFRRRYATAYGSAHAQRQRLLRELQRRLERFLPRLDALERLNLLADLGPPVRPDLPAAFRDTAPRLEPCPVPDDQLKLSESPVCQACGLRLTDDPPVRLVEENLTSLEEALREQNRRLSAFAIGQVLEQPDTAMVDKFLKVLRAGDLETLADVLDDRVTAFLRTFLRQQ